MAPRLLLQRRPARMNSADQNSRFLKESGACSRTIGVPLKVAQLHPWQVSPKEAAAIQLELQEELSIGPLPVDSVSSVGAADVSFAKGSDIVYATVVILSFPDLELVEWQAAAVRVRFPYIPGLLTFREGPALTRAFGKIEREPDVVIFDGQGIAHPRRFGIASHMGLLLNKPSIGCAKRKASRR